MTYLTVTHHQVSQVTWQIDHVTGPRSHGNRMSSSV